MLAELTIPYYLGWDGSDNCSLTIVRLTLTTQELPGPGEDQGMPGEGMNLIRWPNSFEHEMTSGFSSPFDYSIWTLCFWISRTWFFNINPVAI